MCAFVEGVSQIYHKMRREYEVPYGSLPENFWHSQILYGLGAQRTWSSCGQSIARVGMEAQGIWFNPHSSRDRDKLNKYIPTGRLGIDPHPLALGVKKMGIEAHEYTNAGIDLLVELLTLNACFCALDIQAPWASLKDIEAGNAGHYIVAGYADKRKKRIYGWEPGNGYRWFGISFSNLEKVWVDSLIGHSKKKVKQWMLHMPVKI
jgi:hypothetical protein